MKLKQITALLPIAAILATSLLAFDGEEITALLNRELTVTLDGTPQQMHDANGERVYPLTYNGTTYLPIRAVCDMLGIAIGWDEESNTVSICEARDEALYVEQSVTLGSGSQADDELEISLALPAGWQIKSVAEAELTTLQRQYLSLWDCDKRYIYNELDDCVGVIGINSYTLGEGSDENRKEIYSEVAIPTMYCFDIYDRYDIVKLSDRSETALTTVRYSRSFMEVAYNDMADSKVNSGILSLDRDLSAYVMIELEAERVSEARVKRIAESVQLGGN